MESIVNMGRQKYLSSDVYNYFTMRNAKIVAFLLTVCIVLYHGFIHSIYGNNSCHWLLTGGSFQGHDEWQPFGCMMHKYTKADAHTCTKYIDYWGGSPRIAFVGDSRIRQLYFNLVNLISDEPVEPYKAHADIHFKDEKNKAKVDFIWQPIINSSMINAFKEFSAEPVEQQPTIIVVGSATWIIKSFNGSAQALEDYTKNISQLVPYMDALQETCRVIWMLQDPVNEEAMWESRAMITNDQVNQYNEAALKELGSSSVHIWSSSRGIAQGFMSMSDDGLHLSDVSLAWDIQILLNLLCNEHLRMRDGQCCTRTDPVSHTQILTACFFALCTLLTVLGTVCLRRRRSHPRSTSADISTSGSDVENPPLSPPDKELPATSRLTENATEAREEGKAPVLTPSKPPERAPPKDDTHGLYQGLVALSKLGVIMAYFYICDRKNFFMKENKHYTHMNFILPCVYFLIIGIFFNEKSKQTAMLHRDQTDEWKGWMQLVILIYHYTGASQVLPIYMQIRVLVSAYLFMSGFGHFCFFWNKGDYSLHRFFQVMFRMNFLVVKLCFVMNRPYQFYYFVPLVSFWYLVIYVTMALWPRPTAASAKANPLHYVYIISKFVLLATAICIFYASEVLFERVFLTPPLQSLFTTPDGSIHEWHFRWWLDRFSTMYGMIFAFVFLTAQKVKLFDDSSNCNLFSRPVSIAVGVVAGLGFLSYTLFTSTCTNKQDCNYVHSYIAFVPIICFVLLRNIPGCIRVRYSTFFAWFGRISLELFIGQYHIWLAADTYGLLVLVPGYPMLNTLLSTFIFVCIAHEIHIITGILTPLLVPTDWKYLVRNSLIFAAVLLPLGITHGAFNL